MREASAFFLSRLLRLSLAEKHATACRIRVCRPRRAVHVGHAGGLRLGIVASRLDTRMLLVAVQQLILVGLPEPGLSSLRGSD